MLAGCGDDSSDSAADPTGSDSPSDSGSDSSGDDASRNSTAVIASTADVPEGGGLILKEPQVVITQAESGDFKAFSSICTHQGCPVTAVTETIDCSCHGSSFSLTDGSPVAGPATSALEEQTITVTGQDISLG